MNILRYYLYTDIVILEKRFDLVHQTIAPN
jgi:hypothetical protein